MFDLVYGITLIALIARLAKKERKRERERERETQPSYDFKEIVWGSHIVEPTYTVIRVIRVIKVTLNIPLDPYCRIIRVIRVIKITSSRDVIALITRGSEIS